MSEATVLSTIPTSPSSPPTEAVEAATEASAETPVIETAPAEVPKEEPKPDPDLEISRKLDQVSRQAAKNRRVESELQSLRTQLDKDREDVARMKADLESALDDPVEYYIKKGKDPVEVAKRFAKPMSEEEKRIAKLEEAYKQREEADKKAAEERTQQQKAADEHRFWSQFVGETTPDEYPYLTSMHDPNEVPKLVRNLIHRPIDSNDPESPTLLQSFRAKYDRDPTPKEIREALEAEAETRATSLLSRFKPRTQSQVTPSTPLATEESTSLSNQHAQTSTSARPGNESREERVKRLKAELEAETATSE